MGFRMRFLSRVFVLSLSTIITGAAGFAEDSSVFQYQVKDGDTLSELSTIFFGTQKRWKDIADWNLLSFPYELSQGKILNFKEAPRNSESEGRQALLAMWRKRFELSPLGSDESVRSDTRKRVRELIETQTEGEQTEDQVYAGAVEAMGSDDEKALGLFREARREYPQDVKSWIQEIKLLKKLGRKEEEKEVTQEFLKEHPNLKALPFLKDSPHQN